MEEYKHLGTIVDHKLNSKSNISTSSVNSEAAGRQSIDQKNLKLEVSPHGSAASRDCRTRLLDSLKLKKPLQRELKGPQPSPVDAF